MRFKSLATCLFVLSSVLIQPGFAWAQDQDDDVLALASAKERKSLIVSTASRYSEEDIKRFALAMRYVHYNYD